MTRQIGKLLFSRLHRDQQRRRMRVLLLTLLAIVFEGGMVVAVMYFMNRR
jgi:hypothetical protein